MGNTQKQDKMICFLNSFISVSGGDTRFIEVFKRITKFDKYVITSLTGKRACAQNNLNAFFILTTIESTINNLYLTYLFRILRALVLNFKLTEKDVIYSSSDFLPDTLPAYFMKLRNKKASWVICVGLAVPSLFRDYTQSFKRSTHLSIPTRQRLFYYFSQQLTISFAKRSADHVLVFNKIDEEFLLKKGIKASKLTVVNGGVDYNQITNIKSNALIFDAVFLGRLHHQKGIFDLIKLWRVVCDNKPKAKLCIIGSGQKTIEEQVRVAIKDVNLSNNVELVGSTTNDEKFSLLKSSRLFLCPSHYESFAIVIAEAMACGLPVVAYNLPIYEDIYGDNISKVPLGDIVQFAKVIIRFLDDDNLRVTFGLAGQKFIQKYDWVKIAQTEYQVITEVK